MPAEWPTMAFYTYSYCSFRHYMKWILIGSVGGQCFINSSHQNLQQTCILLRQSTDALLIFHRSCSCDKDNCRLSSSCCSSFSLLHGHIGRETPHKSMSSFSTLIYSVLPFPMQIFVFRIWPATCYFFSCKYSCWGKIGEFCIIIMCD